MSHQGEMFAFIGKSVLVISTHMEHKYFDTLKCI